MTHFVATFLDLTERRAAEESINQLAYYDPLTQLGRTGGYCWISLSSAQATARREGQHGALLLVDLDAFKWINDGCGHETGDQLLREAAARRSKACVQKTP